jgi:hypothetical protein
VAVDLDLPRAFSGDVRQLFHDLVAASETVPGVRAATVAMRLPTQVTGPPHARAPRRRARARITGDVAAGEPHVLRTPSAFR